MADLDPLAETIKEAVDTVTSLAVLMRCGRDLVEYAKATAARFKQSLNHTAARDIRGSRPQSFTIRWQTSDPKASASMIQIELPPSGNAKVTIDTSSGGGLGEIWIVELSREPTV